MYIVDGEKLLEYKIDGNYPVYSPETAAHYKYTKELDKIDLVNNEDISINLEGIKILKFETNSDLDRYTEPHKIIIDWGDGNKDTYIKRIDKPLDNIGGLSPSDWKIFTHSYAIGEIIDHSEIKISCINEYGTAFMFTLPFTPIYKSLSDIGTKFKIISANITNDGETSYVLKHVDTDSIVFVRSEN